MTRQLVREVCRDFDIAARRLRRRAEPIAATRVGPARAPRANAPSTAEPRAVDAAAPAPPSPRGRGEKIVELAFSGVQCLGS